MTVQDEKYAGGNHLQREGFRGKPELKEPLACEAAEVPIGVGFLNRAVGKARFVLVTHQSACDSRNLGGTASLRPFV